VGSGGDPQDSEGCQIWQADYEASSNSEPQIYEESEILTGAQSGQYCSCVPRKDGVDQRKLMANSLKDHSTLTKFL
jgi:hypothetical protein